MQPPPCPLPGVSPPSRCPGCPNPEYLQLGAASLGQCGSRGLPPVPPPAPPCLAEERPLVPSVPSTSPSRRSRRGESAKKRMETEQVGGQLWPGPPQDPPQKLTPCCRHRLAPGTPGTGQERVLQQRGRRGPLGRVGLEAAKDESLGLVRHGLGHLWVHLEHAHLEERSTRGCRGSERPGWGRFGGGDPPRAVPKPRVP